MKRGQVYYINFYPRSPCGERQFQRLHQVRHMQFLSTLSLRRATKSTPAKPFSTSISIHALLAESDHNARPDIRQPCAISIHALLAESDAETAHQAANGFAFLSTLSLRRATIPPTKKPESVLFLSTLSLRRATEVIAEMTEAQSISIHALLAESD